MPKPLKTPFKLLYRFLECVLPLLFVNLPPEMEMIDGSDDEDDGGERSVMEEESGEREEEESGMEEDNGEEEEDGSSGEEQRRKTKRKRGVLETLRCMLTAIGLSFGFCFACLLSLACLPLSVVCISTIYRSVIGSLCVCLSRLCVEGSGERKRSTRITNGISRHFLFYTWRRLQPFHFLYVAGFPSLFFLVIGGVLFGVDDSRREYRDFYGAESYAWAMPAIVAVILYCQLLYLCVAFHWTEIQAGPMFSAMSFFRPMPIVDAKHFGPRLHVWFAMGSFGGFFLLFKVPEWLSHNGDNSGNEDGDDDAAADKFYPSGDSAVLLVHLVLQLIFLVWTYFARRAMSRVSGDSQLWRLATSNLGGFMAKVDEAVSEHSSELRRQNKAKHHLVHYLTLYYLHVASDDSSNPISYYQETRVARAESVDSEGDIPMLQGEETTPEELENERPAPRGPTTETGVETNTPIERRSNADSPFGSDDEADVPLLQGSSGMSPYTSEHDMAENESEVQRVFDALTYLLHAFPTAAMQRDKNGNTPLHLCAMPRTGSWYTFNTFIDGIKPDQRAARIAETIRHICPEAIESRNAKGQTPLEELESAMEGQKLVRAFEDIWDIAPDEGFVLTYQVLKHWDYDKTVASARNEDQVRLTIDLPEIEYEDLCIDDEAVIGSGASKVVYRGMYVGTTPDVSLASGTFVALHKYHRDKPPAAVELRAICRASVASPYLARFYAHCWTPFNNRVCLMQELATYGSVERLCSYCDDHNLEFSTSHKLAIAQRVLLGVEALHSMNIVHGDIAARNVLIFEFNPLNTDSLRAKLTDFGLARNSSSYYDTGDALGATLDSADFSQVTAAAPGVEYDRHVGSTARGQDAFVLDFESHGGSSRNARSGDVATGADFHGAVLPIGNLEDRHVAFHSDNRPPPQPSQVESPAAIPIFWAAPETLSRNKCHEGSDIWAYGVFLWELFTECHRRPWWLLEVEDRASMLLELKRGERLPSEVDTCSVPVPVYDLLLRCWGLRRKDRPSVRQVKASLDALIAAEAERLQRAWMSPGLAWYCSGITPLEELEAELQEQDAFRPLSDTSKVGVVTKDGGARQRSFWGTVQELILGRGRAGAMARGLSLERIDLIKNTDALRSFKAHVHVTANERRERGVHAEEVRLDDEQRRRLSAMEKWSCETDMMDAGLQHGCRVVLAWHGCSAHAADIICRTRLSMREFHGRDSGYFGRGVYLTPEAEYAAKYAIESEDSKDGRCVLLLCAVLCDRVYPVTEVDYDKINGVRAPASCFAGFKPLQPGFDTHLVAIRCDREYQAATVGEKADYHEIVVGQEAQLLPLARVEVRLI